jgi:GTP-binding protein EngB required for normal cell division
MNEVIHIEQQMTSSNEYYLQKVICGMSGKKCYQRRVTVSNRPGIGLCIVIYSKNNRGPKPKNVVPVFLNNPLNPTTVTVGSEVRPAYFINRGDEGPILLTSQNTMLLQLFYNEVYAAVERTVFCRDKLQTWSKCMQCQLVKCVYSLQNKRLLHDKILTQDAQYQSAVGTKNRTIARLALNYLSLMLHMSGSGYNQMVATCFGFWKNSWEQTTIGALIKQKHTLIKDYVQFFGNIRDSDNTLIKRKSDIDDIHQRLGQIYTKLVTVHAGLGKFKSFSVVSDENKLEIVENLQQIADLRHHIQTINNTEEEIVLIGDQSSGKSSLLCQLLGVNIAYTDHVFATRCPVRYVLEPCDPKLGWRYEFEEPDSGKCVAVSQDELQKRLIHHFKGTVGKMISFDPLTIRIRSPVCTSSMTLVDLPGLVGNSDEAEKQEQHKTSYALVNQYLGRPNIFILFVHRFDVDIGSLNTQVLDTVKRKHRGNVMYCVTHFDRYCTDKDITYGQIFDNVVECSKEVAGGSHMFLLSLSKRIEDLTEKELASQESIRNLLEEHGEELRTRNINFNLSSVKTFLRKKIHKHVLEFSKVLDEYVNKQKYILSTDLNASQTLFFTPQMGDLVLDSFLSMFKSKTHKLLRGQLIPVAGSREKHFFETLAQEVESGNKFSMEQNVPVWPSEDMVRQEEGGGEIDYQAQIDQALRRDLVSHALLSRTVCELKMRLCSVSIEPNLEDIVHGITFDPNINLDMPKDSTHCVMTYTIQRQLDMDGFFNYGMKRLQYVLFKIIKYVVWSIAHSGDTPPECLCLIQKPTFQAIFELELHNFISELCAETKLEFIKYFDEITCSPIVMGHAVRYKEMLMDDFGWSEEDIATCCDESIFKPKNIGSNKQTAVENIEGEELERIKKIQSMIKLHIHVRMLMMSEHMTRSIDYNWRRMLDDTKESMVREGRLVNFGIFEHIKNNVCKRLTINGKNYPHEILYSVYNGTSEQKVFIDPTKIEEIQAYIENLSEFNEKLPGLLSHAVKMAGNRFL